MNLGFIGIRSWWASKAGKNSQISSVDGDNNSVDQSITTQNYNIYVADQVELQKTLKSVASSKGGSEQKPTISGDLASDNDAEEFKLLYQYREIANDGDAGTALKLLEKLRTEERYKDGYAAFRLAFNMGIILQNIGEYEAAAAELRRAHSFAPDNPKALTGLALVHLLEGRDEAAFSDAEALLSTEGDHVNLCAAIAYNAAKRLRKKFDVASYEFVDVASEDVVIARLDYIWTVQPEKHDAALAEAIDADPANEKLASMWAHAVLKDAQGNRAFLMGSIMPDCFEENVAKCAAILQAELERSLAQNPPNMLLLPYEANNAAVALRLDGRENEASALIDKVLERYPNLTQELAQIKAALLLQQDRDSEAYHLVSPMVDHPEFQVMASEIEAQIGNSSSALARINSALKLEMPEDLRCHALAAKARIGINIRDRSAADEAIEELTSDFEDSPNLALLLSAYSRAFGIRAPDDGDEGLPPVGGAKSDKAIEVLKAFENVDGWEFFDIYQAAQELFVHGHYRRCCELLRDRVSLSRESPALQLLCDACIRSGMATLARNIWQSLPRRVKESVFGWKFGANTAYLTGEIPKAVPLTRKLFDENRTSLKSLRWYIQSLLRANDVSRIRRVVGDLIDAELVGDVSERREYVNLLNFCGFADRARLYAYRLYCENRNDHRSWMALSSSVLAVGAMSTEAQDLQLEEVELDAAVEVLLPSGETRKFILEGEESLFPLRQENISVSHPIAQALIGRRAGDAIKWPLKGVDGDVIILSIKHKALDAFHFVLQRFEEQFPDAEGFTSIKFDPSSEDGLEELMSLLQERAKYGERRVNDYKNGSIPLSLLGSTLGLDPIDTFIDIYQESGTEIAVSTCKRDDQDAAAAWLKSARKSGVLLDAISVYLLRRLDLAGVIEEEFGKIKVTQTTVDIYSRRLHAAQTMGGFDDDGKRRAGSMAYRGGRIVLTELSDIEIERRVEIHEGDLSWLQSSCEIVPAVASEDPSDVVIQVRNSRGGEFLDDLLACDGCGLVLVSDDLHLRQWGLSLFGVRGVWIQSVLFHLLDEGRISSEKFVSATIVLLEAGEYALCISSHSLMTGAKMLASNKITWKEFELLCSMLGQRGAEMQSHIRVALEAINGLWRTGAVSSVTLSATGIILRKLVRHQGADSSVVLDTIQTAARRPDVKNYISNWRIGHFM